MRKVNRLRERAHQASNRQRPQPSSMVITALARWETEQRLRRIQDEIERELSRRPDTDLRPTSRYMDLVAAEARLLDELEVFSAARAAAKID
jgi:hypothetical protein